MTESFHIISIFNRAPWSFNIFVVGHAASNKQWAHDVTDEVFQQILVDRTERAGDHIHYSQRFIFFVTYKLAQ